MINSRSSISFRRGASLGMVLLAAIGCVASETTAVIPPPEKLLPGDTLLLFTVPDCAKFRQIWQASPQSRLWNDPAMKPFRARFLSKFKEELVQPLERELGVSLDDYVDLPQGQLTLALTSGASSDKADQGPGFLLLLDARDKSAQLKKDLGDLRKKWVDSGKPIRTERIRGVEFSVVQISSNDVPKTLQKYLGQPQNAATSDDTDTKQETARAELVFGQCESLLILGNSIPSVEKVAVHLTGGNMPSLSDLAAFETDRLAVFRGAPLYGWINAKAFFELLRSKSSDQDSDNPNPLAMFNPDKIVAATGLSGLKTIAFAFQNSSDGSLFQLFAGAPESDRRGLLKLFPARGKEAAPPPFVPADVIKFQRTRIDGQKAWATVQSVLNDISPQLLSGLNFMLDSANTAAKEKDPGFDIKKDLFGNLGDDFIVYQKAPGGASAADLNAAPSLYLIGSPQPERLAAALKSVLVLFSQQAGSPKEREFLGRKIYSVPLPPMPNSAADPLKAPPRMLSYAASGGYLALATDASILEEYLRSSDGQGKALRQTPGLTEAESKVGGTSTGLLGYENQAETTRAFIETLRKSAEAGSDTNASPVPGIAPFPVPQSPFKDWLDFSLLPPFDKIAKYFYFTVYGASGSPEGFSFKMYAPAPPQLKN